MGAIRAALRRSRLCLTLLVLSCGAHEPTSTAAAFPPSTTNSGQWNTYSWDSLFPIQVALAKNAYSEALDQTKTVSIGTLAQSERMWLHIYRGFALDSLGRRTEAIVAYRTAASIHAHPLARTGQRVRIRAIQHLSELLVGLPPFSVREGTVLAGAHVLQWRALLPSAASTTSAPTLIRVGHPDDAKHAMARLIALRRTAGIPEDAIIVHTNVLASILRGRSLPVDHPELLREVPRHFDLLYERLLRELPIDARRVHLMGYSFDGVWAWILGYAHPQRYAGIVALSAVSYPEPILNGISGAAARRVPACVLRAEGDHMFPKRLSQERRAGDALMRQHQASLWKIIPNAGHADVWKHASTCFVRAFKRAAGSGGG